MQMKYEMDKNNEILGKPIHFLKTPTRVALVKQIYPTPFNTILFVSSCFLAAFIKVSKTFLKYISSLNVSMRTVVKDVQNQKSFWRSSQNCFVLALFSSLYS